MIDRRKVLRGAEIQKSKFIFSFFKIERSEIKKGRGGNGIVNARKKRVFRKGQIIKKGGIWDP